jgi:hypothetical protein
MPIIAYRYDSQEHAHGQIVKQTVDHIDRLTPTQREAELLVRAGKEDGTSIRGKSVYSYRDRKFAEFGWSRKKGMHLYEVEIDDADIVHKADLAAYTAVEDAHVNGQPTAEHVARYWTGAAEGRRLEILAIQVRVVRKLKVDSDR